MPTTIDVKIHFKQTDMTPGPEGLDWVQDCLNLAGKTDDRGYSYADTLLRQDEGAVMRGQLPFAAGAVAQPGAPPIGAGAGQQAGERLRRGRVKGAFTWVLTHVAARAHQQILSKPPYFGNGPEAFDYVREHIVEVPSTTAVEEMNIKWYTLSIAVDVGSSENTVKDILTLLQFENALRPEAHQFSTDAIAEKLLSMIQKGSKTLTNEASRELNAVEGVPGQPNVRLHQMAPAVLVLGGAPVRRRDLTAIVSSFHTQWRDAVRGGMIPVLIKLGRKPLQLARSIEDTAAAASERGLAAVERAFAAEQRAVVQLPPVRDGSPSRSLAELDAAGFNLVRGTTTTSDFRLVSTTELARAAEDGDGGDQFVCEIAYDANDTLTMEMLCNNCRGPGHPARLCPSPKKFRSFDYVSALLLNAKKRAEERGTAQGHAEGGRRPMPRGQVAPFRSQPRRFSASHPFRRFNRGTPVRANAAAQYAGDAGHEDPATQPIDTAPPENDSGSAAVESVQAAASRTMPLKFGLSDEGYYDGPPGLDRGQSTAEVVIEPPKGWAAFQARVLPPYFTLARFQTCLHTVAWALTAVLLAVYAAVYASGHSAGTTVLIALAQTASVVRHVLLTVIDVIIWGQTPLVVLLFTVWILGKHGVLGARTDLAYDSHAVMSVDSFDTVERCYISSHLLTASPRPANESEYLLCYDSGCSCYALPEQDEWMLSEVIDDNPRTGLEVASGSVLAVKKIGKINTGDEPTLVTDSFAIDQNGNVTAGVSAPTMSRVLITKGLKRTTRLVGVGTAKRLDRTFTYFNPDNAAGLDECVRFSDMRYAKLLTPRFEIAFRRPTPADLAMLRDCANVGYQAGSHHRGGAVEAARSPLSVHASLAHVSDERIRHSDLVMDGVNLSTFTFDAACCPGCRAAKTVTARVRSSSAPSMGGGHMVNSTVHERRPSTYGYTRFGERVDADLKTHMPISFPHGFTCFMTFTDRFEASFLLSFQVRVNSTEVASSIAGYGEAIKHRLADEQIWRLHLDNDLAYDGADAKAAAAVLAERQTRTVPNDPHNPTVERKIGVIEQGINATLLFAGADGCLWPWAAKDIEGKLYFIQTRSHNPAVSPYRFTHRDAGAADLSWAHPLFCDVVVHLDDRDVKGNTVARGCDGCYFGHDFKRDCQIVYLPSLRRIASFNVTSWRDQSFECVKGITHDTPVNYRQNDLRCGEETAAILPKQQRASKAVEKEGAAPRTDAIEIDDTALLISNATRINEGVKSLEKEGEDAVVRGLVESVLNESGEIRRTPMSELARSVLAADDRAMFGEAGSDATVQVEIVIHGNDVAHKVAEQFGIKNIATVEQAMASPYWELIEEAMNDEIKGKLANLAWVVIDRAGKRVMKSKWVFVFKLSDEGAIVSVKARFVGCGYSQVEGMDYDKVYAATLPSVCFRSWCTIVADEDLDTDSIDAVKAFTQSDVDRDLYVDMPVGFSVPGCCLWLKKALEGIRQGAYLWFQKNKWAWNKCGMFADVIEPNLYTHPTLRIIAAVFADDVGAGFKSNVRAEYLAMRTEYSKLIKIDSPGPETTVPVEKFTGVNVTRDRAAGTVTITMQSYLLKLKDRRKGEYTLNDMPTEKSKAKRTAFEELEPGTEATMVDRGGFMERLGEIGWPTTMVFVECAFHVSKLGTGMQHPTAEFHKAVRYVLGYMINNIHRGITYGGALKIPLGIDAMPQYFEQSRGTFSAADSSWNTRARPYGGHVVMRMNGAILWSAKPLKIVADSSAHAETAEASRATKSTTFVRMVFEGVHRPVVGPTALLGDNKASFEMSTKEGASSRSRHFERATILVKYAVMRLIVVCRLISTRFMIADIFTKAVDEGTFKRMRAELRNEPREAHDEGKLARIGRWLMNAVGR
jgi:hypothetical protein